MIIPGKVQNWHGRGPTGIFKDNKIPEGNRTL